MPVVILSVLAAFTLVIGPFVIYFAARIVRIQKVRLWRAFAFHSLSTAVGLLFLVLDAMVVTRGMSLATAVVLAVVCLPLLVVILKRLFKTTAWRAIGCYFLGIVINTALALATRATLVEAFRVPTGSMSPTILPGDRVLADKVTLRFRSPQRGDVVVFHPPHRPEESYIRRVVAIEGDRLEVRDNRLYINGESMNCKIPDLRNTDFEKLSPTYPCQVPSGKVYILGDDRARSLDSRAYGFVDVGSVFALAGVVYASREPDESERPRYLRSEEDGHGGRIRWERIGTIIK